MSRRDEGTDALRALSRRLVWWKSPENALADRHRLLAQIMALGTADDVSVARRVFADKDFLAVLADPPAGVFDPRSWAYWHVVFNLQPAGEAPKRRIDPDFVERRP